MRATVTAEVDSQGNLHPDEPLDLLPGARVLITVVDPDRSEAALLSETSLSVDWNRLEEDAAWSHLARLSRRFWICSSSSDIGKVLDSARNDSSDSCR